MRGPQRCPGTPPRERESPLSIAHSDTLPGWDEEALAALTSASAAAANSSLLALTLFGFGAEEEGGKKEKRGSLAIWKFWWGITVNQCR